MILNILEVITRNQADLDLSETSSEVFPQSPGKKWSFIGIKLTVSTNSTVFHPLLFRNLKIFLQLMVLWSQLFENISNNCLGLPQILDFP
jgi:hypothetical protein